MGRWQSSCRGKSIFGCRVMVTGRELQVLLGTCWRRPLGIFFGEFRETFLRGNLDMQRGERKTKGKIRRERYLGC